MEFERQLLVFDEDLLSGLRGSKTDVGYAFTLAGG